MDQLLLGFFLALAISLLAYFAGSLSRSGAAAAALLGTLVFGLGGLAWAVLLVAFFVSSSALSRLFGRRKAGLSAIFSKGGQRDAGQVLANGGVAGLFVLLHALFPLESWPWAAFAGSLAAVNADTWATELGVLSRTPPRLITTGQAVQRGTSGAISGAGTLAAFGGALLIGALAALLGTGGPGLAAGVALAGLAGSLVDSALGAACQAIYTCPTCQAETERHPYHTCGTVTELRRGWRWMNNDLVNVLCALSGAVLAAALFIITKGL